MANAEDISVASQQNNVEAKAVDADGHETGKGLVDDKISIKGTTCERFSIRGYVARTRKLDRNTWPFHQHLLETRLKETGNMALPPLEIPEYRWWNCENCLGGCLISRNDSPTSSVDIQEKLKENILDDTEVVNADMQAKLQDNMLGDTVVESLTVQLKSGGAVGSSTYETDKEKKNEGIVTDSIRKHVRTVPMKLENHKSENPDLNKNKNGTSHCQSNSRNSEEIANMSNSCPREHDENGICEEMVQAVMETMSTMLLSKKRNELGSKQKKSEELQIPSQAPNSWEYFSGNKNVFKEISEKIMKGKEREQAISPVLGPKICPVLGRKNSLDANKSKAINKITVSIPYAENVEPDQQVVVEGKYERTISIVESLTVQSIQNGNDSHRALDTRNDVPCSNGNDSTFCDHIIVNKKTEVKECTELSTSQAALEREKVLLSEQTRKLRVSEYRSKRKPQKIRSIADIIASKPSCPESWNKETEEFNSNEEKEENISMTENAEKSPRPKEDHMKVTIDTVRNLSKPTIDTKGISEVNIIIKERRPEKLTVRKKRPGTGIEYLDPCSTFVAENTSTSSLTDAVTNAFQMPQGTSPFLSSSRNKAPQHNSFNAEYEQCSQKLSEMEDEIPMDIVELMAKNQHERGLSNLKHFHEIHYLQKDRRRLGMKQGTMSQVNKHVKGGTTLKKNTATPKMKAQPKQIGKALNLQASSRNHCQSGLLVDYGQTDVSLGIRDNSIISEKEGTTYGSCEGDLARLQSTQRYNRWGNFSQDFAAPVLDETISACNLPFPIDGSKSQVAITHCDRYGAFSTNSMVVDSRQLGGVSTYRGHVQMQNLCPEGTPALSDFTDSVLPIFQNKFESSLNYNGYSNQNLTRTESSQNFTSNILSKRQKGNGILNLPISTDEGSGLLYFNGQSNSALLQQVNAQARQPFGKKYCFPSTPVLRLMGQSVSAPAKCRNEETMATENRDDRSFFDLSQASSQKHVSWFQSSRVTDWNRRETLFGTERVFTGSKSIQDSMCMNEQIISSIKTIPPVPNFTSSGHYASNGLSEIYMPSSAVNGKADVALESSILRTKSPFLGTLLSGEKRKKGLQCANGYNNGILDNFSTTPPACQSAMVGKSSSSTKGVRSYRPTPMATHHKGNQRSALDKFLESRQQCFESSWVLGPNPHQNLTKEEEKAKALKLNKENKESAFCGKKACNVEICTLNQNPAEISIDGEEDGYSFGYGHFTLSHRDHGHSERKRDMAIPQGMKRRRTLKKKNMQEFLKQDDGYVGDPAKINVDHLDVLGYDLTSVKTGWKYCLKI